MWYSSATGWLRVGGRLEPQYEVRYAESQDGVAWRRFETTAVAARPGEAIARPFVVQDGDSFRMWYSYRGSDGYRTDPSQAYRIGYAVSDDGLAWRRRDDEAGLLHSESGWDSVMTAYPSVYDHDGTRFLLYNGDGFGRSGIGHAVLRDTPASEEA